MGESLIFLDDNKLPRATGFCAPKANIYLVLSLLPYLRHRTRQRLQNTLAERNNWLHETVEFNGLSSHRSRKKKKKSVIAHSSICPLDSWHTNVHASSPGLVSRSDRRLAALSDISLVVFACGSPTINEGWN